MKTVAFALLALALVAGMALGDQSTFASIGRTNQVATERRQFGDVKTRIDLNTIQPDGSRLYDASVSYLPNGDQVSVLTTHVPTGTSPLHTTSASCDGDSYDTTCYGVKATSSCTWGSLTSSAQAAITLLLGTCTKICTTSSGTLPWGETYTSFAWSCVSQNTANCVLLAGNDHRIDLIEETAGCQY